MKHAARRRFGQHFLVDRQVIAAIVDAIGPLRGDLMVEIGPGLSALTAPLLDRLAHLHAVEIDRDLAQRLRKRFDSARLTVHEADALSFDFGALGAPLRVVGNLPYNISSPLLFHLAGYASAVRDQHFMLQKEVVDRMVAGHGSADYGRLSVMLQVRYRMERLFDVGRECFEPPPEVTSAVVRMIPRAAGEVPMRDAALFAEVVAAAFSQRRKMLRNALAAYAGKVPLEAAGISATDRAQDLAPEVYVRYAEMLAQAGGAANAPARA